jgi:hypothetical protein
VFQLAFSIKTLDIKNEPLTPEQKKIAKNFFSRLNAILNASKKSVAAKFAGGRQLRPLEH